MVPVQGVVIQVITFIVVPGDLILLNPTSVSFETPPPWVTEVFELS